MTFQEVKGDGACCNPVWCCWVSVAKRPESVSKRCVGELWKPSLIWTNPPRAACTPTSRWPWTSRCFVAMTTQLVAILLCHCGSIIFCSSAETFGGCTQAFPLSSRTVAAATFPSAWTSVFQSGPGRSGDLQLQWLQTAANTPHSALRQEAPQQTTAPALEFRVLQVQLGPRCSSIVIVVELMCLGCF